MVEAPLCGKPTEQGVTSMSRDLGRLTFARQSLMEVHGTSKRSDRQEAMEMVDKLAPDFIVGSPPCTPFCSWNVHMNFRKMKKEDVDRIVSEGRQHLNFMAKIYRKQILRGKYFVHEHPATAVSWDEREILKLAMYSDVVIVTADQCQYGLTSPSQEGKQLPALKPTKFMTNAMPMARLL